MLLSFLVHLLCLQMAEYEVVLFTILCGSIINRYLLLVEKVIAIVCVHMQHVHCF